jgi:hypothetical protein
VPSPLRHVFTCSVFAVRRSWYDNPRYNATAAFIAACDRSVCSCAGRYPCPEY